MNFIKNYNVWLNESIRDKMTPVSEEDIKKNIGEKDYNVIKNFKGEIKKLEEIFPEIIKSNVYKHPHRKTFNDVGQLFSNKFIYIIELNHTPNKGRWVLNISKIPGNKDIYPIPFFHSIYKNWDKLIENLTTQINKYK